MKMKIGKCNNDHMNVIKTIQYKNVLNGKKYYNPNYLFMIFCAPSPEHIYK